MLVHCRVTLATRGRRQLSCNCYLKAFSQPIRQILWSAIRLSVVNPKPTKNITTTNKKKRRTLQEGDKNVKTSYLLEAGKTYVTRFSKQIIRRSNIKANPDYFRLSIENSSISHKWLPKNKTNPEERHTTICTALFDSGAKFTTVTHRRTAVSTWLTPGGSFDDS